MDRREERGGTGGEPGSRAPAAPDRAEDGLILTLEDPFDPVCVGLIDALWIELGELYGNEGPSAFTPDETAGPGTAFVVARDRGEPVGCGAIRPMEPGVAEIKRMFVAGSARRRGVARRVLERLEAEARRLGYSTTRLETGIRQPEAIRLYETSGYHRIPCYGAYADDPLSVCFEKRLEPG